MALNDYKWVFKTDIIELVKSENPFGDYYVFDFKAPNSKWFTWEHWFFSLTEKIKDRWWRALSIASNPEEGIMKVATKIGNKPSQFKAKLKSMKKWDTIKLRGPFGNFKIQDQSSPIILIAWGIGIAPMRAFLEKLKHNTSREVILLYSSHDWYLFQEEFNEIEKNNDTITLHYLTGRQELSKYIKNYALQYSNRWYFYISGTLDMIKWATNTLTENKITKKRILNDPFYGY